jgi:hypothetical protein
MSKYDLLPSIIEIAQVHLPQLEHDIDNASTLFTLQAAVKQLHQFTVYVTHHLVLLAQAELEASMPRPQAPAPPPQPQRPIVAPMRVPPPASAIATLALPKLAGPNPMAAAAPAQGQGQRIMEVSITPQGTNVTLPGGAAVTLPPGTPVAGLEEASRPILTGPNDVVLPPGGSGLTPETAAALAAAGGARNITQDPTPGGE